MDLLSPYYLLCFPPDTFVSVLLFLLKSFCGLSSYCFFAAPASLYWLSSLLWVLHFFYHNVLKVFCEAILEASCIIPFLKCPSFNNVFRIPQPFSTLVEFKTFSITLYSPDFFILQDLPSLSVITHVLLCCESVHPTILNSSRSWSLGPTFLRYLTFPQSISPYP